MDEIIYTHYHVSVQRNDGTPVASNLKLNKTSDRLTYTPMGPLLTAVIVTDPPDPVVGLIFKAGDVLRLHGDDSESPYTVMSVENRKHSVIPDVRLIVRGQMVFS